MPNLIQILLVVCVNKRKAEITLFSSIISCNDQAIISVVLFLHDDLFLRHFVGIHPGLKLFKTQWQLYILWRIWCLLRNGFQSTRYITKTDVSIASQRLGIPRQRLGEQLLLLQRMLAEFVSVTTIWPTDVKWPFDKMSSIRGANTLFQGGKE
jgi:hypothetical protein